MTPRIPRIRPAVAVVLVVAVLVAGWGWSKWHGSDGQVAHRAAAELRDLPGVEKVVAIDDPSGAALTLRRSATPEQVEAALVRAQEAVNGGDLGLVRVRMGSAATSLSEHDSDRSRDARVLRAVSGLPEGTAKVWGDGQYIDVSAPDARRVPVVRAVMAAMAAEEIRSVQVETVGGTSQGRVQVGRDVRPARAVTVLDHLMPLAPRTYSVRVAVQAVRLLLDPGSASDVASALRTEQRALRTAWPSATYLSAVASSTEGLRLRGMGDPAPALSVVEQLGRRGIAVDSIDTDISSVDLGEGPGRGAESFPRVAAAVAALEPSLPTAARIGMAGTTGTTRSAFYGSPADLARLAEPMAAVQRRGYAVSWAAGRKQVEIAAVLPEGQEIDAGTSATAARLLRGLPWSGVGQVTVQQDATDDVKGVLVRLHSTATGRAREVTGEGYRVADPHVRRTFVDAWNSTATEK
ncbi:hypothetical protein [Luteipulveratus halotolerans]|uniref:Uncharacterized protein n=1 Tax=Luteipulveratus halotolerans TaxID=1631356 RepID=A0A0L6CLR9_9MICO|nr:hypothetical protein [Luteipulveratus halotolerans]KNX38458.1 hypothetical protein VV01_17015 [Luteipulveratus halotolerans]